MSSKNSAKPCRPYSPCEVIIEGVHLDPACEFYLQYITFMGTRFNDLHKDKLEQCQDYLSGDGLSAAAFEVATLTHSMLCHYTALNIYLNHIKVFMVTTEHQLCKYLGHPSNITTCKCHAQVWLLFGIMTKYEAIYFHKMPVTREQMALRVSSKTLLSMIDCLRIRSSGREANIKGDEEFVSGLLLSIRDFVSAFYGYYDNTTKKMRDANPITHMFGEKVFKPVEKDPTPEPGKYIAPPQTVEEKKDSVDDGGKSDGNNGGVGGVGDSDGKSSGKRCSKEVEDKGSTDPRETVRRKLISKTGTQAKRVQLVPGTVVGKHKLSGARKD